MRTAGLALAVALGALVSGCGGDSAPAARHGVVEVRDFEFAPLEARVKAGETVRWENSGEQIHNVKGKGFFSRALEPGKTYSFAFRKKGSYEYVCTLHPQMKGTVVVQ